MAVPESEGAVPESVLATARILAELATVREDEIWVVAREKPEGPPAPGPEYDTPGSGAMLAQIQEKKVPLPLKHTDVKGKVSGYIATVEVTQQFQNPFSEKIEAVYVFPLPENAAVNEFIMTIGERRIRGIIRERQEAEQIYQEASRQGYVASLLTQERPNIFTQSVANIEPGKADRRQHQVLQHARLRRRLVRVRLPDGGRPALQPAGQHGRRRGGRPGPRGPLRPDDRSPVPQARRAQRPRHLPGRRSRRRRRDRGNRLSQPRHREEPKRLREGATCSSARSTPSRTRISSCATGSPARRSSRPS